MNTHPAKPLNSEANKTIKKAFRWKASLIVLFSVYNIERLPPIGWLIMIMLIIMFLRVEIINLIYLSYIIIKNKSNLLKITNFGYNYFIFKVPDFIFKAPDFIFIFGSSLGGYVQVTIN